jgi:lipopolysaccharide export system protein LptA
MEGKMIEELRVNGAKVKVYRYAENDDGKIDMGGNSIKFFAQVDHATTGDGFYATYGYNCKADAIAEAIETIKDCTR